MCMSPPGVLVPGVLAAVRPHRAIQMGWDCCFLSTFCAYVRAHQPQAGPSHSCLREGGQALDWTDLSV